MIEKLEVYLKCKWPHICEFFLGMVVGWCNRSGLYSQGTLWLTDEFGSRQPEKGTVGGLRLLYMALELHNFFCRVTSNRKLSQPLTVFATRSM